MNQQTELLAKTVLDTQSPSKATNATKLRRIIKHPNRTRNKIGRILLGTFLVFIGLCLSAATVTPETDWLRNLLILALFFLAVTCFAGAAVANPRDMIE